MVVSDQKGEIDYYQQNLNDNTSQLKMITVYLLA